MGPRSGLDYIALIEIIPWTFDETKPGITREVMIGFVAKSGTKMPQIIIRSWNINGMLKW